MSRKKRSAKCSHSRQLKLETLMKRELLAADGIASFTPGADFEPTPLLGETVDVDLSFANNGDHVGYGPYVDVLVPTTGGIDYIHGSATLVGQAVTEHVITFDDDGRATHPLAMTDSGAPLVVEGEAGDKLVVLTMPFGSFAPEQAALEIELQVKVDADAEVGQSLELVTAGGFRFGDDPLDNPTEDPSTRGALDRVELTPSVLKLEEYYGGPENETTSGSNFLRSYRVDVDIATGETLSNIDLRSLLDDNVAYDSLTDVTLNDSTYQIVSEPIVGEAAAGQSVGIIIPEMTGQDGVDASFRVNFFIPQSDFANEQIVSPVTGSGDISTFRNTAQADWQDADSELNEVTVRQVQATTSHEISDQAIAVQQTARIVENVGGSHLSVGDVLEYTLHFQVSDHVAVDTMMLNMVVPDGQTYLGASSTSFTVNGVDIDRLGGAMQLANTALDQPTRIGEEHVLFDISNEIKARGGSGTLAGGLTTNGSGTGVYGAITMRTVVDDAFAYDFPSGDASIDEGDTMLSTVVATARMLDVESLRPSSYIATDDSSEWMIMPTGGLNSSLHAVNGETDLASNEVSAGDVVTFRIQRTVRGGDVEELQIEEFFPLPVFALGDSVAFTDRADMTTGVVSLGPSDTFHSTHNTEPRITVNTASNQIKLEYGNHDWEESGDLQIDLLVTATVQDQPFADGLLLTSQSTSSRGSTNYRDNTQMSMDNVVYTRPTIELTKGVANADNPKATFSGAAGDQDVSNIDAGDTVLFQVVATNVGRSDSGAHDLTLKDAMPDGFEIPTGGLTLTVTDGAGNPLDYEFVDQDGDHASWFAEGIRLVNPLNDGSVIDGSNQVFVSYELITSKSIEAGTSSTSDAEVLHYAALPNGVNYATSRIVDAATSRMALPSTAHVLISTDQSHTDGTTVVIGEKATYQTKIRIPEGTLSDASIKVTMHRGMAIDQILGVTIGDSIKLHDNTIAEVLQNADIRQSSSNLSDAARILELNLGDLTNVNLDDDVSEYVTVEYVATVINETLNQTGVRRRPSAKISWGSQSVSKSGTSVLIAEPTLQITKSYNDRNVDADDRLTVTVAIQHTGESTADAFDLALTDSVPAGVTYVADSLIWIDGAIPSDMSDENGGLNATWASLPVGSFSNLQYQVTVNDDVSAGTRFNTAADLQWSSLSGDPGQISSTSTRAYERTGDVSDEGGSLNDYSATSGQSIVINTPSIDQKIDSTSAGHTDGANLTIGESVTLQVIVTVPEGRHDLILEELVSTDAAILDLRSVTLTEIGENLSSDELEVGKRVLAADHVHDDGIGDQVKFDLGTVTNQADGVESIADQLVFTVEAIVVDNASSRAGDEIKATATIDYGLGRNSDVDAVQLVEPLLDLNNRFSTGQVDAGDIVTVTTTVRPPVAFGSTAFDVRFQDLLSDANLALIPGTVVSSSGEITQGNGDSDSTVQVNLGEVSLNDSIEITYHARVLESASPGDLLTSRGEASWASLESGDDLRTYHSTTVTTANVNSTALRGLVFADHEQDGVQTESDYGIGNVTVKLSGTDHLGNVIAMVTESSPGGLYEFNGLRPGQYEIVQTQPEHHEDGLDYAPASGGTVHDDLIKDITVPAGSNGDVGGYNFTEAPLTWIEGTVYDDYDHNGILGQDEDGIENVLIKLAGTTDEGDLIEREVLTNSRGYYVFNYLPSGTYSIKQEQPVGFYDSIDNLGTAGGDVGNDVIESITVDAATPGKMYNFSEFAPSTLEGHVFIDYDRDDLLDRKDGLVAGVLVTLTGVDYTGENVEIETKTDIDGLYRFENLAPGTYDVMTDAVDSLELSTVNVGKTYGWDTSGDAYGKAVDYGFVGIEISSGSGAEAYDVGHQDPEWRQSRIESRFEQQHFIKASSGDDTFDVQLSESQAIVTVGGIEYAFGADETRAIVLLGSFGNDTANIVGSENKETVNVRPGSSTVYGSWFRVRTYGMENFNFAGGGYEDLVRMYDDDSTSTSSELVTAPFTADYKGEGWHNTVKDIHRIYVYANHTGDTAKMSGSEKRDNFVASHRDAKMLDGDYYVYTRGFDDVQASSNSQDDRAFLTDSNGDDHLIADADQAVLSGEGYRITINDFNYANVSAKSGGHDTSVLNGSSGYDRFVSRPSKAEMITAGTRIIAAGFETVDAHGNGGSDRGYLFDSHYQDTLTANPSRTVLENAVNIVSANDFDRVYAFSDAGGNDISKVTGSEGNDIFYSRPLKWTMAGSGYYLMGRGFTQVAGYASEGFDRAFMHGSRAREIYTITPDSAKMTGRRFTNEAHGFDKTYGYGADGNDQVIFRDQTGVRSTVRYNGEDAAVFGSGYSHKAEGFEGVDAYYNELSSSDRVELSGKQAFEVIEVDLNEITHKLALRPDADAEQVDVRDSVDEL